MLFQTQQFLVFFSVVFTAYWTVPQARARVWILLAASFYFYASWNHWLAVLVFASSSADYVIARAIQGSDDTARRRMWLTASVVGNLGLLAYFKYANFFLDSLESALRAAGADASLPVLQVILPVGISFYTFEAISYTTDVFRRRAQAERSLPNFLLFITFFPHLIAGPIVRARHFLPQVRRPKRWSWSRLELGVQLFLIGLFKKVVVADWMAAFADPVFADPTAFRTGTVWIGAIACAIQIYCDFSGYTDMALGTAHMLGYKLVRNFNMPFLAANIAEFWRRWHISLSTWLRDYLFIPLGGSRGGRWKTYRNLMVTMTLGGLWHGAAWPFVCFGALQGLWLVGHRAAGEVTDRFHKIALLMAMPPATALRIAATFLGFCITLVVFRAVSLDAAGVILGRMFAAHPGGGTPERESIFCTLLGLGALSHALVQSRIWPGVLRKLPPPLIGLGYVALLMAVLLFAPGGEKPFVYFQF